jgi:steroid 5-alpha reductase family enzyme
MSPFEAALLGYAGVALAFSLVWLVQLRTRDAGLIDSMWSWTLGLLAVWYAACGSATAPLRLMLAALGGAWGLRLGTHLFLRNHGKPEDGRYRRFRESWGAAANRNLFWFFQFQSVFSMLLSLSFAAVAWSPRQPAGPLLAAAAAIWLVAVLGEGLADWQLEHFKRRPGSRGQVCRDGLWRYSRHPNYFFECLHWLAYLPLAAASPWWWLTLAAPLVMAWLLLKLSGVPLTEAQSALSRPGYAEYMRSTSVLIPWPPKKQFPVSSSQFPEKKQL